MSNDNHTIDQKVHQYAIERGHRWKAEHGMDHLPDYGVRLEPAFEAKMRALAAEGGVDFEDFVARFEAKHQVIPRRDGHTMKMALLNKGVVPVNALPNYFHGALSMQVQLNKSRMRR